MSQSNQQSAFPVATKQLDTSGITQRMRGIYQLAASKPSLELVQVVSVQGTAPPTSLTIKKIGATTNITGVILVGWSGSMYPIAGEYIWVLSPYPDSPPIAIGTVQPKIPRFRAYLNVNAGLPTSAVPGIASNIDGNWVIESKQGITHSTVTNPSRIILQYPGLYDIDASLNYAANGAGLRWTSVMFNGGVWGKTEIERTPDAIFGNQVSCHTTQPLNAGDFIELYNGQNAGAGLQLIAGTQKSYISVVKLADLG